ncbi:RNA polymerase sigma factor [Rhodococcus marinonascens]|uniref:RNA polymerase sigma factor n=1 Tax=Rhodococcus marinonascens TaxID=38311 RepID=UPI000933970E|nr:sigma-70 family RNA polymerase sigma factor [Rhodococcus marinonascens]
MHPPEPDDHDERARGFRQHVEPEIEVLLRVARTLTGPADAEDLVQETLVRAWRSVDRFDGRYPRAWLLTILRNTNMNMHRRRRPDAVEDVAVYPGARPAFGVDPPSTEDRIMASILPADLERAVQALDSKFRTVLFLIDVDQLTYSEAADALGVPVGTVMSRLSRARDRVRKHLRPSFAASMKEKR